MKKLIAIVALIAFVGVLSAPAIASINQVTIAFVDKDPKKAGKDETKKSDAKSSECKDKSTAGCAGKSSSCCGEKKTDPAKK